MTPILGAARVRPLDVEAWATRHKATERFARHVPLYYRFAPERGVRPEVAYVQAAHETAFGHYGGVLDASYHNLCGLKTRIGGGDLIPEAHMRYPTWEMGVIAHLDHLASYASSPGYPRPGSPDLRNSLVYGYGATVEAMGRRWASAGSDSYANGLLAWLRELKAV